MTHIIHQTPLALFVAYMAPGPLGDMSSLSTICVWMVPGTWVD